MSFYSDPPPSLTNFVKQVAALDNLTGGATVVVHTDCNTPSHLINRPENNFVDAYFTPQLLPIMAGKVQEPLNSIVDAFIVNVQVPLVESHRNFLHAKAKSVSCAANRNVVITRRSVWGTMPARVWGTIDSSPKILSPSAASVPVGISADIKDVPVQSTPPKTSVPLLEEWCEISKALAVATDPTAPASPKVIPTSLAEAAIDLCTSDEDDGDAYIPLPPSSLQRFARPKPYVRIRDNAGADNVGGIAPIPNVSSGSLVVPHAVKLQRTFAKAAHAVSSNSSPTISMTTSVSPTMSNSPVDMDRFSASISSRTTLRSYGIFQPIVPPGPCSEEWLSNHQWPPQWANVL